MKISFRFCILALAGLASCAGEDTTSDKVASDSVYQKYTVIYTEGSSVAHTTAEFRVNAYWDRMETEKTGGTAIKLVSPSEVKLNSKAMEPNSSVFTGAYYSLQAQIPADNIYSWTWTDNSGRTFTNAYTLNPVFFKDLPRYIDYRNDWTIGWEGGPVGENESVLVAIDGTINGKSGNIKQMATRTGETQVTFTPTQLRLLEGQAVSITVSRRIRARLQDVGAANGNADLKYESKSRTLQMTGTSSN